MVKIENKGEVVVYQMRNGQTEMGVKLENNDVWLTQAQMTKLFNSIQQNISLHIGNIFREGELRKNSVHKESLYTAADGKSYKTSFYNLDMIISVGYRVKSPEGIRFRQWATTTLKNHLTRGFSFNEHRLKQIEDKLEVLGTNVIQFTHNVNRFFIHTARQGDLAVLAEDLQSVKKIVANMQKELERGSKHLQGKQWKKQQKG